MTGMFEPMRNRDFLRLLMSNGLWWQALWIEQIVVGWLALALTDSAWWVALVGFFRSAPMLFVGVFGPALTERFQRRHLILATQTVNFFSLTALTMLHLWDLLQYWHLGVAAVVTGTAWGLDWPTRRSLFPDLFGKSKIVDALFIENMLQSFSRVSGPVAAGTIVTFFGTQGALVVLSGSAAISAVILVGIRSQSRSPERPSGLIDSAVRAREGLRYAFENRTILGVLLITVVMNMWAFPYQDLLPVFARDVLGTDVFGLGILGAASGFGNVLGLVLMGRLRKKQSNTWIFSVASSFSCLGLIAFSQSTVFGLSLAILVAVGIGHAGFSLMQSSIILVEASDSMRTRTMSALVLAIGFGPLGRIQAGAMAESITASVAVLLMSSVALVCIVAVSLRLGGFVSRPGDPIRAT